MQLVAAPDCVYTRSSARCQRTPVSAERRATQPLTASCFPPLFGLQYETKYDDKYSKYEKKEYKPEYKVSAHHGSQTADISVKISTYGRLAARMGPEQTYPCCSLWSKCAPTPPCLQDSLPRQLSDTGTVLQQQLCALCLCLNRWHRCSLGLSCNASVTCRMQEEKKDSYYKPEYKSEDKYAKYDDKVRHVMAKHSW